MSKEMMVIALGFWILLLRLALGVPGSWQTFLFILTGVALIVIGFLLRGEAISRELGSRPLRREHAARYPFIESAPAHAHEQREGINSLN